jgi:hypothetical protein
VHRTVQCAPDSVRCLGWRAANWLLSKKVGGAAAIIYWAVRCGNRAHYNDRPRDHRATRGLHQLSPGRTGLSGVSPDCPVCHGCRSYDCSLSDGAPDCSVRPQTEGNNGLPNGAPTAPSCLRVIKGTPRRMEQYIKHPLNILRHRDFVYTHLVHRDRNSSTFLSCNSVVLFRVLVLVLRACCCCNSRSCVCCYSPPYSCVYLRSLV